MQTGVLQQVDRVEQQTVWHNDGMTVGTEWGIYRALASDCLIEIITVRLHVSFA